MALKCLYGLYSAYFFSLNAFWFPRYSMLLIATGLAPHLSVPSSYVAFFGTQSCLSAPSKELPWHCDVTLYIVIVCLLVYLLS